MSKIIAASAIRGAHAIVGRVEKKVNDAVTKFGEDKEVKLPKGGDTQVR